MCFEPSTSSPLWQAGGQDPSSRRGRRLHYEPCATIETCIPMPRSCPQLVQLRTPAQPYSQGTWAPVIADLAWPGPAPWLQCSRLPIGVP